MRFADTLHGWYDENRRDLPWRGEKDPYKIWISEIILQQTRVKQGWDYYIRFIDTFPDIQTLSAATLEQVLKVWQGLGYYSRARNIHKTARIIMAEHHGKFPENYDQIIRLKGIGEYTAAAIASIAYNAPYPAVDGNVFRVICRVFGIYDDIQQPSTKKKVTERCCRLMVDFSSPGEFNEAMMDFGAMQCVPRNPDCDACPFQKDCFAYQHDAVNILPVKIKNIKIRNRKFHYFLFFNGKQFIIRQRNKKDIWQELFELPLIESDNDHDQEVADLLMWYRHSPEPDWAVKHQLTHQTIKAFFYRIKTEDLPAKEGDLVISINQIKDYPFPKIIDEFLGSLSV